MEAAAELTFPSQIALLASDQSNRAPDMLFTLANSTQVSAFPAALLAASPATRITGIIARITGILRPEALTGLLLTGILLISLRGN